MTDRATFTYVGPEQNVRVGSETLHRNRSTLVTDPGAIAEARAHPEIEEDGGEGRVPVAKVVDEPQAAEAAQAEPAAPKAAAPKRKAAKKK